VEDEESNGPGGTVAAGTGNHNANSAVTLTPRRAGLRFRQLDRPGSQSDHRFSHSGHGGARDSDGKLRFRADLAPSSLSFGTQTTNTSVAKTATLTNPGATSLSITGLSLKGNNAAQFSLSPGSTCGSWLATATVAPDVFGCLHTRGMDIEGLTPKPIRVARILRLAFELLTLPENLLRFKRHRSIRVSWYDPCGIVANRSTYIDVNPIDQSVCLCGIRRRIRC
jgi:hypothetical protein